MIYFTYTDWSLVIEMLATKHGWNLLQCLLETPIDLFQRVSIDNLTDLQQVTSNEGDLFDDNSSQQNNSHIYLVDIQKMDINDKFWQEVEGSVSRDEQKIIYFYSSYYESVTLDQKKVFKKNNVTLVELKNPSTSTKAQIVDKYCEKLNLKLNKTQIQQLTELSLSYNQIINNLDLLSLSSDYDLALENVLIIPKPLLFTQSFRLGNLDKDISKWQDLSIDDLQLGLSLVFGKLEKQVSRKSEYLQYKLIQTDQKIKTQSKITPSTWWKLFLWQAKQVMQEK